MPGQARWLRWRLPERCISSLSNAMVPSTLLELHGGPVPAAHATGSDGWASKFPHSASPSVTVAGCRRRCLHSAPPRPAAPAILKARHRWPAGYALACPPTGKAGGPPPSQAATRTKAAAAGGRRRSGTAAHARAAAAHTPLPWAGARVLAPPIAAATATPNPAPIAPRGRLLPGAPAPVGPSFSRRARHRRPGAIMPRARALHPFKHLSTAGPTARCARQASSTAPPASPTPATPR
jgi:hypothetical protein